MGIDQAKLKSLAEDWTIGDTPEDGRAPGAVPLEEQVELGWIVEHDPGYLAELPPV